MEVKNKKGLKGFPLSPCYFWSRLADSNRRPHPYHGCALPAELSRLIKTKDILYYMKTHVNSAVNGGCRYKTSVLKFGLESVI